MRLPRGTFCKIIKAEQISSILDELYRTNFTGVCSISSTMASGSLVFKSGRCILAKIQKKSGDGAWNELLKVSNQKADAALSSLDEAQIQLALEFNNAYRIVNAGKSAPSGKTIAQPNKEVPGKPEAAHHKPAPPSPVWTVPSPQPAMTVRPSAQPPQPQPLAAQKPAAPVHATPKIPVPRQHEPEKPAETKDSSEDSSSFEQDIDTFEKLDLDNVTDKIRNDCKTMIKQLQLEHLME